MNVCLTSGTTSTTSAPLSGLPGPISVSNFAKLSRLRARNGSALPKKTESFRILPGLSPADQAAPFLWTAPNLWGVCSLTMCQIWALSGKELELENQSLLTEKKEKWWCTMPQKWVQLRSLSRSQEL